MQTEGSIRGEGQPEIRIEEGEGGVSQVHLMQSLYINQGSHLSLIGLI